MLWLPDAVAGATGARRRGEGNEWASIDTFLTLHELPL